MKIQVVERRVCPPARERDWFAGQAELLSGLAAAVGPEDLAVELTLVDDDTMTELNGRWRGVAGCTDVLSFSDLEESDDPLLHEGVRYAARPLALPGPRPAGSPELEGPVGELVIAPHFVTERCLANGWSPQAEFPLLVVHGLLHILGWEHDTDSRRRAMQDAETAILAGFGLSHPLRKRS